MVEIPLVTEDVLSALPHDVVVDIALKLQQISLQQDDQIQLLNRLVSVQKDTISIL
jgi:hypothetical protein